MANCNEDAPIKDEKVIHDNAGEKKRQYCTLISVFALATAFLLTGCQAALHVATAAARLEADTISCQLLRESAGQRSIHRIGSVNDTNGKSYFLRSGKRDRTRYERKLVDYSHHHRTERNCERRYKLQIHSVVPTYGFQFTSGAHG